VPPEVGQRPASRRRIKLRVRTAASNPPPSARGLRLRQRRGWPAGILIAGPPTAGSGGPKHRLFVRHRFLGVAALHFGEKYHTLWFEIRPRKRRPAEYTPLTIRPLHHSFVQSFGHRHQKDITQEGSRGRRSISTRLLRAPRVVDAHWKIALWLAFCPIPCKLWSTWGLGNNLPRAATGYSLPDRHRISSGGGRNTPLPGAGSWALMVAGWRPRARGVLQVSECPRCGPAGDARRRQTLMFLLGPNYTGWWASWVSFCPGIFSAQTPGNLAFLRSPRNTFLFAGRPGRCSVIAKFILQASTPWAAAARRKV